MADTYDVTICGAGSAGREGMAGEIAGHGSVLILDAGPHIPGEPVPGVGATQRRNLATQVNPGTGPPCRTGSTSAYCRRCEKSGVLLPCLRRKSWSPPPNSSSSSGTLASIPKGSFDTRLRRGLHFSQFPGLHINLFHHRPARSGERRIWRDTK